MLHNYQSNHLLQSDNYQMNQSSRLEEISISQNVKNISQNVKNISQNVKNISQNGKNMSLNVKNISKTVKSLCKKVKSINKNLISISQNVKNINLNVKNISQNVKSINKNLINISPGRKNTSNKITWSYLMLAKIGCRHCVKSRIRFLNTSSSVQTGGCRRTMTGLRVPKLMICKTTKKVSS
jgi:uncharacterized protein YoxC